MSCLAQGMAQGGQWARIAIGSIGQHGYFHAGVAALLRESAWWCQKHPDYLLPYIRYKFATIDPRTASAQDHGLLPVWTTLIASAQSRGELRQGSSPEQLGIYLHYLYLGALMRWLTEPQCDLMQEFETVLDLFVDGAAGIRPASDVNTKATAIPRT